MKSIIYRLLVFVLLIQPLGCNKEASPVAPSIPSVTIQNATLTKGIADGTMRFYVNANKATTQDISVDYSLADGTAFSSIDYISTSGTLTIPAKQISGYFDVQIKGDPTDLRQPNLTF